MPSMKEGNMVCLSITVTMTIISKKVGLLKPFFH